MKHLSILIIILFCTCPVMAQDFSYHQWNPGDTAAIFGDKINMRAQPSTDAGTVTQLAAADQVSILEVSDKTATLNGLTLPWYKVQALGTRSTGYVWGGLLSIMPPTLSNGVQLVAGAVKSVPGTGDNPAEYQFELRAVRNGAVVNKISTSIKSGGHAYFSSVEQGARGLKGYSLLLIMNMGYEACGYPWYEWYVLWDGSQLLALPVCESIADAGVFSHTESYMFPQGPDEYSPGHYGPEDQVYFAIEHHEMEELDTGGWNENSWKRVRPMTRSGKQWIRPKKMDEPK